MNLPVIDPLATGKNIKHFAKDHKYTAKGVATMCSVTRTSVYKWYSGDNVPTVDNLIILSNLFGVKIDDLVVVRR